MSQDQAEIERLLARRIGLDPVAVGSHLIARATRHRMRELGLDDLGAYERHVRQSEAELQALIEEVVVPESWFFRDERPFQWLREFARARWLADPARPPLRVLSLPCAGGEEPYSIAITLRDLGLAAHRFQIDAVDVSARRLAVARRGVYSRNAFRGSDLGSRARYFREHPQGYELDPGIRWSVRFLQASVLDPTLLEGSPPYNIVFCRNLLIYLNAPARACVLAAIDRLLAPDGVLLIGHADRLDLAGAQPRFTAVGELGCFAYLKAAQDLDPSPLLPPPPPQLEPPRPLPSWIAATATLMTREREPVGGVLAAGSRTADPWADDDKKPARAQATEPPTLLEQAAELANRGRHAEAIAVCQRHLQVKGPGASAFYLMGMISQAAGDRRRAEDCFHKTVYLDPKHDEALLALALLAERRGDRDTAAAFRRRAERSRTITMTRQEGDDVR
jgi:chemotaxis protein methyltransferase WspC